jgi:hypothetical protein
VINLYSRVYRLMTPSTHFVEKKYIHTYFSYLHYSSYEIFKYLALFFEHMGLFSTLLGLLNTRNEMPIHVDTGGNFIKLKWSDGTRSDFVNNFPGNDLSALADLGYSSYQDLWNKVVQHYNTPMAPGSSPITPTPVATTPTTAPETSGGVQITSLNHSFQGDEITVNVSLYNNSNQTEEIRVFLYTANGDLVDKEPDFFWKNISSGGTASFTLKTAWKLADVDTLGGAYRVSVITQAGFVQDSRVVSLYTGQQQQSPEALGYDPQEETAPPIPSEDVGASPPSVTPDYGDQPTAPTEPASFWSPFQPGKIDIGDVGVGVAALLLILILAR